MPLNKEPQDKGIFNIGWLQASIASTALIVYNAIYPEHSAGIKTSVTAIVPFLSIMIAYVLQLIYSYLPNPKYNFVTRENKRLNKLLETPNISSQTKSGITEDINNNISSLRK